MNRRITPEQVEAAKLRIILDRKLNRETPEWVTELSKKTPSRRNRMTDEPSNRIKAAENALRARMAWPPIGWEEAISEYREALLEPHSEVKPKYNEGGYIPGHETRGRKSDHLTRAFLKTDRSAYVASTISPRLSRQDILDALSLTSNGSTFPKVDELLDQREDQIRKNAAWRALADAADAMPEMNGAAYMYYVRTWLHNRAKDAFRGDA